jgi:hypothetical protein
MLWRVTADRQTNPLSIAANHMPRQSRKSAIGMNSTQPTSGQESSTEKIKLIGHLDSMARAIFIIWIGIAMLIAISWGWFLVGLGILILAAQLARSQMNIKIEGFWVAWGALFLIAGLWTILNIASWPLAPIVLILLGMVLLGKAIISIRR